MLDEPGLRGAATFGWAFGGHSVGKGREVEFSLA